MELIPAIDLKDGRCVRLYQGDFAQTTVYGDDPAAMAVRWVEQGAKRLHVVDLDGARDGRPTNSAAVRAIVRAVGVPVQLGGGLRREEDVRARTEAFYTRRIASTYRPGALETIQRHREAGDTVALLTTSSTYLCAPVLRHLGLEHALCNRFEVVEGVFTGKAAGPLCYAAGKVTHAQAFAEAQGAALAEATFYTDSMSDLPMLEAVGKPVAVNPDPRLRRLAQKRGWPVMDWGK